MNHVALSRIAPTIRVVLTILPCGGRFGYFVARPRSKLDLGQKIHPRHFNGSQMALSQPGSLRRNPKDGYRETSRHFSKNMALAESACGTFQTLKQMLILSALRVKRTSSIRAGVSANDPKRTLGASKMRQPPL